MGLLERGSRMLTKTFDRNESSDVVYRRRQQLNSPISFKSSLGQSDHEQEQGDGFLRVWRSQDFIQPVALLTQNGVPFEPEEDDTIEATIAGERRIYRVTPGQGGPCFRYGEPEQISIRIYTKRVKS